MMHGIMNLKSFCWCLHKHLIFRVLSFGLNMRSVRRSASSYNQDRKTSSAREIFEPLSASTSPPKKTPFRQKRCLVHISLAS